MSLLKNKPEHETSTFSWASDIEWMSETSANGRLNLTFIRSGKPLLQLEVNPQVYGELLSLSLSSQKLLNLLIQRRIWVQRSAHEVSVGLFNGPCLLDKWELPADKSFNISLLIGDEVSLARNFKSFVIARPRNHLFGTVRVSPDLLEVSPFRFVDELEEPRTRGSVPQAFPAWMKVFEEVSGSIRNLISSALAGPQWFTLTARGFRLNLAWEEANTPYRVHSAPVWNSKDCIPLFYSQARIESGLVSGGTGESPGEADFSARSEAWERFCMDRPDLAVQPKNESNPSIECQPGVYFDYIRTLLNSKEQLEYCCGETVENQQKVRVPKKWVYFSGKPSVPNTNGAAFGSTQEDAIFSAKLEILERHVFMRAYLGLSPSRELHDSEFDKIKLIQKSEAFFSKRIPRWYYLGSSNGSQVVLCVLSSDSPPFVSIGSAARFTVEDAAVKAFYESAAVDLLWAREIEKLGARQFLKTAKNLLNRDPSSVGLIESGWIWAGMENASDRLHRIFECGKPLANSLDEKRFVSVDIGRRILHSGSVVKVLHPDALPLPSSYAHALKLGEIVGVSQFLPVPMT